ncbi:MAG: hypothetical protein KGZ59_04330 [Chitinophagaceae bacterium]|nr:hypothetical protein [Chitinophagaceae bacterium]
MKSIQKFISCTFLFSILLLGCKKESFDDTSFISSDPTPNALGVMFDITQDNTGKVTIIPNGTSAVSYDVYFGDATTTPVKVQAGKTIEHVYAEGTYNVKVVGYNVTGKTSEVIKPLTVSFRAPENLVISVVKDAVDNYKVNVSATALYETNFRVFWGDVPSETGAIFLEGQTISKIYAATGTYKVKVTAYSGGAATKSDSVNITISDPVVLPLDFQSPTINYAGAIINFDGGNTTVINNPQINGINTSSKVARMVKSAGQVWGGSVISLGNPIDFSVNKVFRMKVYSPRVGAKVLLKVEHPTNGGISFEKEVSTTVANAWEDLVFDYNAINTANNYQKLVLIFDLGTMGDGSPNFTFFFDDIRLTNQLPTSLMTLPITFDNPGTNYSVIDFGGAVSVDAVDPTLSTNKVKRTTKPNGAETWAGTTMGSGFATPLGLTPTKSQMSVRVYSPAAGIPVRLKVENKANPTQSVETQKNTTVANAWETIVFDFQNQAPGTAAINYSYTFDMASIFFDFGTVGNGKVFYWDDVILLASNQTGLALPLDFQSTTLNYTFTNFDGGNTTIINNPHMTGINTSTKVARMVKNAGQVWGGSWIGLDAPINFTSNIMRMKVYSPRVGAKVLLKIENNTNGALNYEKEVLTTVANGWEDLTFDMSGRNTANTYQKVVIIFDLGTMGDGSPNFTFYFDDIRLN